MVNESKLFLKKALHDTSGNCGRLSAQSIEPSIVRRSSHTTYPKGSVPTHRWVIDNRCTIFNRRTIASLCAISSRIFIVSAILLFFLCSYLCVFAQEAEYDEGKIKYLTAIHAYGERDLFSRPTDIFVDSSGDIYLADFSKASIFIFDSDFMPVAKTDKVNAAPGQIAFNKRDQVFKIKIVRGTQTRL